MAVWEIWRHQRLNNHFREADVFTLDITEMIAIVQCSANGRTEIRWTDRRKVLAYWSLLGCNLLRSCVCVCGGGGVTVGGWVRAGACARACARATVIQVGVFKLSMNGWPSSIGCMTLLIAKWVLASQSQCRRPKCSKPRLINLNKTNSNEPESTLTFKLSLSFDAGLEIWVKGISKNVPVTDWQRKY